MTNFVPPGVRGTRQRDPIVILVRYGLESTSPNLRPCREDRCLNCKCVLRVCNFFSFAWKTRKEGLPFHVCDPTQGALSLEIPCETSGRANNL
jgi:hypothetical protein